LWGSAESSYRLPGLAREGDRDDARGTVDREELVARVGGLGRSAVGWSDEEFRYQLRKRCGIEVTLAEVQEVRQKVNAAAA